MMLNSYWCNEFCNHFNVIFLLPSVALLLVFRFLLLFGFLRFAEFYPAFFLIVFISKYSLMFHVKIVLLQCCCCVSIAVIGQTKKPITSISSFHVVISSVMG